MCDLEIQVTESKIGSCVGKRKYDEVDGELAEAEGTVGIGPAFGGNVSKERFAVTQLESRQLGPGRRQRRRGRFRSESTVKK